MQVRSRYRIHPEGLCSCAGLLEQTAAAVSALMPEGLIPDLFSDLGPLDLSFLDYPEGSSARNGVKAV